MRRRQQGEGGLHQRSSDGLWVASVDNGWRNGRRDRRYFYGKTVEDAVEKRRNFLNRKAEGFTIPKGRPPYVSEWMLHWLHNIARPQVQETSWETSYRSKVTELICPYFEKVALPDLTAEHIEAWHRALERRTSRRGTPLSASTIGQAHRLLSMGLKVAVARGRIRMNPASLVSPPQAERPELRPPTVEEARLILAACGEWPNGARWVTAIATGIRQGEALALKWADVKLTAPASITIRVSAARLRGERIEKAPKSKSSRRTVPLPGFAADALRELRKGQVASIGGLVFTNPKGGPWHHHADYADWQALLASLGLPRYRVHDIRHLTATLLLESGQDPRVVQDILGHSSTAQLQVYQHVRPVLHERAAQAIDEALRG